MKRVRERRWKGRRRAAIVAGLSGNEVARWSVRRPARGQGQCVLAAGDEDEERGGRTGEVVALQDADAEAPKVAQAEPLDAPDLCEDPRGRGAAQAVVAGVDAREVEVAGAVPAECRAAEDALGLCGRVDVERGPEAGLGGRAELARDGGAPAEEEGARRGRLCRVEGVVERGIVEDELDELEGEVADSRRRRRRHGGRRGSRRRRAMSKVRFSAVGAGCWRLEAWLQCC